MYSQNAAPHVRPFLNFFLKESILMYQKWKTDNIWIKEVKGAQLFNFPLIDGQLLMMIQTFILITILWGDIFKLKQYGQ